MFNVEHYVTESGHDYVKDYIDDISKNYGMKDLVLVDSAIKLLENHGFEAIKYRAQLIKKLDGDLYELRPGKNRLLFFFFDGKRFVLLHAFRKKTQKTPQHEIYTAQLRMKDYKRRNMQ